MLENVQPIDEEIIVLTTKRGNVDVSIARFAYVSDAYVYAPPGWGAGIYMRFVAEEEERALAELVKLIDSEPINRDADISHMINCVMVAGTMKHQTINFNEVNVKLGIPDVRHAE